MISETIELLGKNVYTNIPGTLTLTTLPTTSELDYVGSEDFDRTMVESILPQCIEEDINVHQLLEIDYQWITRCMRFLNYGPYFTTNMILCSNCGSVRGEYQVDLKSVDIKTLPEDFTGDIVIKKGDLIDYNKEIHLHMLTIQEVLDLRKDKLFAKSDGSINTDYARLCYSISSMGTTKSVTPVAVKLEIEQNMSPADLKALLAISDSMTDYGLRAGGTCACPKCHQNTGGFIALPDDRFFRPTLGDLRKGRNSRNIRGEEVVPGSKAETV